MTNQTPYEPNNNENMNNTPYNGENDNSTPNNPNPDQNQNQYQPPYNNNNYQNQNPNPNQYQQPYGNPNPNPNQNQYQQSNQNGYYQNQQYNQYNYNPNQNQYQPPYPPYPPAPKVPKGYAIASLVLGIFSLLCCNLWGVLPILGLIFGILALKYNPTYKAMAIVAIVCNCLSLVFAIAVIFLSATGAMNGIFNEILYELQYSV